MSNDTGKGSIYERIIAKEWAPETYGVYHPLYTDKTKTSDEKRAAIRAYIAKEVELNNAFRLACYDDCGIQGKVADLLWAKAWEDGHSSGLYEVYTHLCELSALIDQVRKVIRDRA